MRTFTPILIIAVTSFLFFLKRILLEFRPYKKSVRLVCNKSYNSHTAPLFLKTAIVPFQDLKQVNALCFMYEYTLNRLPSSFNNSWSLIRDTDPQYMLRNGKDFAIPRLTYQYLKSHPLFIFRIYGINLNQCLKIALLIAQRFPVI